MGVHREGKRRALVVMVIWARGVEMGMVTRAARGK